MSALLRLWQYIRPQLGTVALAYMCMILLNVTHVIYAALMGPALEYVFSGDLQDVLRNNDGSIRDIWNWLPPDRIEQLNTLDANQSLWVLPLFIIGVALIKGLGQTGQFFLFGRISQHALRSLRGDAFNAMLGQSPSFYNKRAHGDLLSRLTHDAGVVEQALFNGVGSLLRDSLAVLGLLGYVFWADAKLALVTFVTVPVAVLPLVRFSKWLKRVSKRGQTVQGDINAVAYEALAGVRVVQAFGAEAHERKKLSTSADGYYSQMLVSYFIRAIRTPTMEVLGAAALAGLVALLGYHLKNSGGDTAHYVSFLGAIFLMYDPLKRLGRVSDFLAAGASAAERIFEITDLEPDIVDAPNAKILPPFETSVVFESVSFSYEARPVLSDVSITLHAGQTVALVGPSGAGKTTLANLLPRFYDVSAGSISIGGMDIRTATLASLRSQIALVNQETFLFNTSVAENIAYGRPDAALTDIREAAEAAYAEEFIRDLPKGYDTIIGERGVRLSGGQRQRLAIARALLRNAPLLVLDEATSSLDTESERYVQQALDRLMKNRTSLVIAHRLSTIRRADLIVVLKDGRVVEHGSHDTLIGERGEYARLYELQFKDVQETGDPVSASL